MGLLRREGESVRIDVGGMTCDHCVARVSEAISSIEGVSDVRVSLEDGHVDITYDPGRVTVDRIRRAIVETGYEAR